jgi:hypothetical protein
MNKRILFVGQCKQGSNSLFNILSEQPELCAGNNIRAMVCSTFNKADYFANWDGVAVTDEHKYLLDKSIINPSMYDYHVGDWVNYNHKMVYMFRNIYDVIRSQFLVVLAGEASYQYCIPKDAKSWSIDLTSTIDEVMEVLDYNEQKFTHLDNIKKLPADVFDIKKNVYFCTFEDFKNDTDATCKSLSEFIGIPIDIEEYPHLNKTADDWYKDNDKQLEVYKQVFDKYKDEIYAKYVSKDDYIELSELIGIDLVSKYCIK